MKFGEFTALINRNDRIVRVCVEGDSNYNTIDADGRPGRLLNGFDIDEIAIVNSMFSLKLKEADT